MMRYFLAILSLLLWLSCPALAQQFFVSTTGSDTGNNCQVFASPCATIQHAVDQCPGGSACGVSLASGVYSQKTNVIYFRIISVTGPLDGSGNCINRSSVVIDDGSVPGSLFFAQDLSAVTLNCMTLAAYASGSVGLATRQFAIADANNINFINFPNGIAVTANETSKINIYNPGVYGGGSRWASAADLSQITVGGAGASNGPAFDVAMISVLFGAVLNFYPSSWSGSVSGYSFQCVDAVAKNYGAIPGSGAYSANDDCHLR